MAYHLHRLKISNAALAQTGLLPPAMAHDLSQGRLQIAPVDVATLAHALQRPENDFSRHLEPREQAEWHFYRLSARNRLEVWHRARNLWQSHHMTQRAAAAIMHCHPSHISHALQDHPNQARRILALPPAERLTAHLHAQDASIYFLTGLSTRR